MRFFSQNLIPISRRVLTLASLSLLVAACATAQAAEPPKNVAPTVDIDVEDRGADKQVHVAHFSLVLSDSGALLDANDGDARYAIEVHAGSNARLGIKVKRDRPSKGRDLEVTSTIANEKGPRVVIAKIERVDGQNTSVVAQIR